MLTPRITTEIPKYPPSALENRVPKKTTHTHNPHLFAEPRAAWVHHSLCKLRGVFSSVLRVAREMPHFPNAQKKRARWLQMLFKITITLWERAARDAAAVRSSNIHDSRALAKAYIYIYSISFKFISVTRTAWLPGIARRKSMACAAYILWKRYCEFFMVIDDRACTHRIWICIVWYLFIERGREFDRSRQIPRNSNTKKKHTICAFSVRFELNIYYIVYNDLANRPKQHPVPRWCSFTLIPSIRVYTL